MRRSRRSIAGLLVFVSVAAVGLAGLRSGSDLWASLLESLALLAVLIATLGAAFRRGEARAFWAGFALASGAYLYVASGRWLGESAPGTYALTPYSPIAEDRRSLITDKLLDLLYRYARDERLTVGKKVQVKWGGSYWACSILEAKDGRFLIHYENHSPSFDEWVGLDRIGPFGDDVGGYRRVGHSLFGMLLGLAGAGIAVAFHAAERRDRGVADDARRRPVGG
jgi:hypothetical protein